MNIPLNTHRLGLLFCLFSGASLADIYTVTNTSDSGPGSLRQAILTANAQIVTAGSACAGHSIVFAIPGIGPHTIRPLSALPVLVISTLIDGYSQAGSVLNSAPQGSNAILQIELDGTLAGGTLAGAVDGLSLSKVAPGTPGCSASGSRISGLAINRFQNAGVRVENACQLPNLCELGSIRITGNFIGTDVTGNTSAGNAVGIVFGANSSRNVVGDQSLNDGGPIDVSPANLNVISGNLSDGIDFNSTPGRLPSSAHTVRGNVIGLNASATAALGNARYGIFAIVGSDALRIQDNFISANGSDGARILASETLTELSSNGIGMGLAGTTFGNAGHGVYVGGTAVAFVGGRYRFNVGAEASVRGNAGAGVFVTDSASVDSGAGSVAGNGGLGFDIAPLGVNANDDLDIDGGPNEGLNYPQIHSANRDPSGTLGSISGVLNANPGVAVNVSFYFSNSCDASGFGEAQAAFPGVFATLTPDASGNARFSIDAPNLPVGKFLSSQTRRRITPASSNFIVSEYSNCVAITGLASVLFRNGFE